jgi:hypothetical protein
MGQTLHHARSVRNEEKNLTTLATERGRDEGGHGPHDEVEGAASVCKTLNRGCKAKS